MGKVNANTYSEVYSYLNVLGENFIKDIPSALYNKIIEMKNNEYNPEYKFEDFEDCSKISKEAQIMILSFHYKYWCKNDDEKSKIVSVLENNEKKALEDLDPFKDANVPEAVAKEETIQETDIKKKSFISSLVDWIKRGFQKVLK